MKRTFSFTPRRAHRAGLALVAASTALIAVTYGLVRLAFGLYLPEIQADLGFDAGVAGAISSGGSSAYVVGAVAGFAAAGRRFRGLVVAAGATAAIGAAGMALAPDVVPFAVAAVLGSTGAGLASPALVRILQRGLDDGRQAGAQAVVNAGTGPGLVAAGVLAFALLPHWRLAWFVAAGAAIVAAGAVLVLERRASDARSRTAPGTAATAAGTAAHTTSTDTATIAATTTTTDTAPPGLVPPLGWIAAHRWVLLAALLAGGASAGVWNYGRTLLADAGVPAGVSV
jgi:MFS family permease